MASIKDLKNKIPQRQDDKLLSDEELMQEYRKKDRPSSKPIPAFVKTKEKFDEFLTENIVEPLASRGYENLGAGLATIPGTAAEFLLPETPDDAMMSVIPGGKAGKAAGKMAKEESKLAKIVEKGMPPAANAQKTQIAGTLPTYVKAGEILDKVAVPGKTLDFGAGLGVGAKHLGADTFEPFPRTGFSPTFKDMDAIPDNAYDRITNLNVLNVVDRETRDGIVKGIGRVLSPGGTAIITTRGKDVLAAKGAEGPEAMSKITSIGTYQKGFTPKELKEYITETLGEGFNVENVKLGPAGVIITKGK